METGADFRRVLSRTADRLPPAGGPSRSSHSVRPTAEGRRTGGRPSTHRIRDYWLVAIPDKRLEVYREPAGTVSMNLSGDSVAPPARPAAAIAVDDLLP